jgi:peptidoglycan/LPS O-acetylase OafA/YrhL
VIRPRGKALRSDSKLISETVKAAAIGILILLLGALALALFAFNGLDDNVAPWLTDLLALTVMFALIAAVARGATCNDRRPGLAPGADNP